MGIVQNVIDMKDEFLDNFSRVRMRARMDATISLFLFMWTAPLGISAALTGHILQNLMPPASGGGLLPISKRRVVLLTEAKAEARTLHVARSLGKAGHRVVIASNDEDRCSTVKYSKYVWKFYQIPRETRSYHAAFGREYIRHLVEICKTEHVDWVVPIGDNQAIDDLSGRGGGSGGDAGHRRISISDSAVGQVLSNMNIKSLSNHKNPHIEYIMSNKLFFMTECKALRLPVPEFHLLENPHELRQLHLQGLFNSSKYCLRPLSTVTDLRAIAPVNNTNTNSRAGAAAPEVVVPSSKRSFETFLRCGQGSTISENNPHMLFQKLTGFQLVVNTVVESGSVVWLDVTSSVDLNVDTDAVVNWIKSFCGIKQLNGFMSFLFVVDVANDQAFCIDCKPTLSHNIIKKHQKSEMLTLERAIRNTLEQRVSSCSPLPIMARKNINNNTEIVPVKANVLTKISGRGGKAMLSDSAATTKATSSKRPSYVYWMPQEVTKYMAGKQTFGEFLNVVINGKEANWDGEDPLPYLVSHVIQTPQNFLSSMVTGRLHLRPENEPI